MRIAAAILFIFGVAVAFGTGFALGCLATAGAIRRRSPAAWKLLGEEMKR